MTVKVLIVESDNSFRDYLAMIVEKKFDVDLYEMSSGNEALTLLNIDHEFDMVFTEITSGKSTGSGTLVFDFFEEKKIKPIYMVIAPLADKENKEIQMVLTSDKRNGFIPKPFEKEELAVLLEDFVAEAELVKKMNSEENAGESDKSDSGEPGVADYSLKKEKNSVAEVEADWEIMSEADKAKASRAKGQEVDADWSVEKKTPKTRSEKIFPSDDRFEKIKLIRFLNFKSVNTDIYVRLNEKKFLKVMNEEELYDENRLIAYKVKGARYLYIPSENYESFADNFSNLVTEGLKKKGISTEERSNLELSSYGDIHDRAKKFGISQKAIEQAELTTESTIEMMKGDPDLAELFKNIMKGDSFISEHSLMLTYTLSQMVIKSNWGGKGVIEKLSMACILHDAFLDSEELAKKHDQVANLEEFTKDEQKILKEHPIKAANLITNGKTNVMDVDNIIAQHHERPDGQGYPQGRTANTISPLTCLFIIGEFYVSKVYGEDRDNIDPVKIYEAMKPIFNRGNFKKGLEAFHKAFVA